MKAKSLSKIAAALGMTLAAIGFGAPQSPAFGAPPASLRWLVGSGASFECQGHADRMVPMATHLSYSERRRLEEPVLQLARVAVSIDGSLHGTIFVASEDSCTLDIQGGQLEMDRGTGIGTAKFNISAAKKMSDIAHLPCSAFVGNRQTFTETFNVIMGEESRITGVTKFQMQGEVDIAHPDGINAPVPVEVSCVKQSESLTVRNF